MTQVFIALVTAIALFLFSFVISNFVLISSESTLKTSLIAFPSKLDTNSIHVIVKNDYAPIVSSALYPWDNFVEPYVTTTLTASIDDVDTSSGTFSWTITYQHKGDGIDLVLLEAEGESIEAVFTYAGQAYTVTVEYVENDLTLSTEKSVMCKYVRREIRAISENDRENFLNTLDIVYRTDLDEGKSLYGDTFKNSEYFTIKHVALDRCNPFHGSMAFLTSHAAFTLEMEKSMQLIEPSITIPYWDYSYDSQYYGNSWDESIIFDDDWFGTTQPDNRDGILDTGRFAFTPIPSSFDRPVFNSYGRITSRVNNDPSKYLTRSHSICGLPTQEALPSCEAILGCLQQSSLEILHGCLELEVHSYFHMMIGGAWDCPYPATEIEYLLPKLNSSISLLLFNTVNFWTAAQETKYLVCPTYCSEDTEFTDCACSCPSLDAINEADGLNEETVIELLFDTGALPLMSKNLNALHVDYDNGAITVDGLSMEESNDFLHWLLLFLCHPGKIGSMGTNAAPNDPVFWPIHPTFDRILAFASLAPVYEDFDFSWVDGSCYGSGLYELLPFQNLFNEGTSHDYSNQELLKMFDPSNPELPYIYDTFEWKNCNDEVSQDNLLMQEVIHQTKGILPQRDFQSINAKKYL